jgi:ABC-type nitrate/sulfonate/bicarbonate transport system substrate-binding protein
MVGAKIRLSLILVGLALLFVTAETIGAQPIKLRAVYPEVDVGYLPAFLAQSRGIFKAEGLDVELIRMRGAREGIQALVAGDIQFNMSIGPALPAIWGGSDLKLLVQMLGTPVFSLIVRPEIHKIDDLRGKKVGVSFGGMTFALLHETLRLQGINPEKGVEYINVSGAAPKITALEKGLIVAALLPSPSDIEAIRVGFKRLLFIGDILPDLPFTGLISTSRYINDNAATIEKIVKAMVRAIYLSRDDREAVVGVLQNDMKMKPNDAAAIYNLIGKFFSPLPKEPGLRKMAEIVSKSAGIKPTKEPLDYLDFRFVNQAVTELGKH